jgi:hypothetical protein
MAQGGFLQPGAISIDDEPFFVGLPPAFVIQAQHRV